MDMLKRARLVNLVAVTDIYHCFKFGPVKSLY